MFAKTTWVRFNVTQDKRDPEEKRLGDELTAACAEMGMYDDDSDGPPPEIFERFCIAVRRCCESRRAKAIGRRTWTSWIRIDVSGWPFLFTPGRVRATVAPMTWLSLLITGVLLNQMDMPMSKYHVAFISAKGKLVEVITTDKDGKFQVDLAPGTYRYRIGLNGTYRFDPDLEKAETITVDKSTSTLKLHDPPLREPPPPAPHVIEVIRGTQRDYVPVVKPPVPTPTIKGDPTTGPHVIEIPYQDLPLQEPCIIEIIHEYQRDFAP